jgi:hypothetical protein
MNEIILTDLPTETLAEMAAEKAALVEQHGRKTVQAAIDCGRYLTEIKGRLAYGEWLPWLEENWQYSRMWASQFMKLANVNGTLHLENAGSIGEALRMIGEAEEAAGTKRTRKPAEPAPEVIDNRPESRTIAQPKPTPDVQKHEQSEPQPANQSRGIAHDLPPDEPASLPRTNTRHTPATRQQIDHGPDSAPAQAVEDAYGMPLLEVVIAQHTTAEVVAALVAGMEGTQAKRVAAILREAADKLDPQPVVIHHQEPAPKPAKPGKHPSADQLMNVARTYETAWSGQLMTQVSKWAQYKQSLTGNAKVRSLASWETMLTRIDNVQKMRGAGTVCEMINKAIANGWQGWEHDSGSNGKPTVASTRIDSGEDYSDLEYRTA